MKISAAIYTILLSAAIVWPSASYAGSYGVPGYDSEPESIATSTGMRPGGRAKKAVTPYGDFCPRCSKYGMGKRTVSRDKAVEAISHYFISKGFSIKNIRGKGRFLKVDIYRNNNLVDRVIFDRRTGRIRSIY